MVFVCSFPVEVKEIESFYKYLGSSKDSRHYYVPENYLTEFFGLNKEIGGMDIFLQELSIGQLSVEDTITAWLGINKDSILHMTLEEMNTFIELVNVSGEKDVYLNLMEAGSGDVSMGQHIFINSLIEIVRRFRNEQA